MPIFSAYTYRGEHDMRKLMGVIGASLGSWIGWWIGAHRGFMTAFFLSAIGAAVGLYVTQRFLRNYLG